MASFSGQSNDVFGSVESLFAEFNAVREDSGEILTGKCATTSSRSSTLRSAGQPGEEQWDDDTSNLPKSRHIVFSSSDDDDDGNSNEGPSIISEADDGLQTEADSFSKNIVGFSVNEKESSNNEDDKVDSESVRKDCREPCKSTNGKHVQARLSENQVADDGYEVQDHISAESSIADRRRIEQLERELEDLKERNSHYLRQLRIIQPNRYNHKGGDGPVLQILFMNHKISRDCMAAIEKSVSEILESEHSRTNDHAREPRDSRPNYVNLSNVTDGTKERSKLTTEPCMVINAVQYFENFAIDVVGWPLVAYNPSLSSAWNVPRYSQHFKDPLPCDDDDEEDDNRPSARRERPKMSCFNCGGEHTLNDCPEPRNHQRIRTARLEFQQKFSPSTTNSNSRYHVEHDPRFSSFKPGVISDKLREALGLRSNDLPPFIYQMRKLGYPPGHLENAKVVSSESGLTMFGKHGCEISKTGESLEEGEYNEAQGRAKNREDTYNAEMLIDYPGFNVRPPAGTNDESKRLGTPSMLPCHMKEAMMSQLKLQTGKGLKRPLDDDSESGRIASGKQMKGEEASKTVDMDLVNDDEEDPLVLQKRKGGVVIPAHVRLEDLPMMSDPRHDELSAEDISKRNQLNFVVPVEEAKPVTSGGDATLDDETMNSSASADTCVTPSSTQRLLHTTSGSSLECLPGTPVLAESLTSTPAGTKGLPDSKHFAEGMAEHIMFENLPNATGTYEKLRTALGQSKRSKK